jgi:hypothetical protein
VKQAEEKAEKERKDRIQLEKNNKALIQQSI